MLEPPASEIGQNPAVTSPAIQHLQRMGVPFSIFVHHAKVDSLEQAASERGQIPDQVVRSILFRLADENYIMALMPGPSQISWKLLRKHLSTNRLALPDASEVKAITGYELGAVNPFGLNREMRILIDHRLPDMDTVSLGSGIRGTAILIRSSDLVAALPGCEILQLVDPVI